MLLHLPVLNEDELRRLGRADLIKYIELHKEANRRNARRKLWTYFPDTGPLRRELYKKHMKFFEDGATHKERLFLAANRIGKTEGAGGYEMACHLTGHYPKWWPGRKFGGPIRAWLAGKNNETARDIVQAKMFGDTRHMPSGRKLVTGTGMVPGDCVDAPVWKRGTDLIDSVRIKHFDAAGKMDGWSRCGIKSYEQGRGSFEGTEKEAIWLDEEPPLDIYTECITRLMTTNGIMLLTFTPLEGMSEVVLEFLEGGKLPGDEVDRLHETDEWPTMEESSNAHAS